MRKSSRGNPNHYPKGSPKGGQFAPKSYGGDIIRSEKTPEEYEKQTEKRIFENLSQGEMNDRLTKAYIDASRTGNYDEYERLSDAYVERFGYDEYRKASYAAIDAANADEIASKVLLDEDKKVTNAEYEREKNNEERRNQERISKTEGNVQRRANRYHNDRGTGKRTGYFGKEYGRVKGSSENVLRIETDSNKFKNSLDAGRLTTPYGCYVDTHDPSELSEMKMLLSDDGLAGIAVESDGNICCAFKNSRCKQKGMVDHMLAAAKEHGGTKMDCFGRALVNMYEANGFEPVARIPFNEEYVDKTDFNRKLLENEPDVYVLKIRSQGKEKHISSQADLDKLPLFDGEDGYDNAMKYRDQLLEKEMSR